MIVGGTGALPVSERFKELSNILPRLSVNACLRMMVIFLYVISRDSSEGCRRVYLYSLLKTMKALSVLLKMGIRRCSAVTLWSFPEHDNHFNDIKNPRLPEGFNQ
jgi:hypothetical protein